MTFSIVARDPETGSIGVATATAGPVVGSLVPHGRAGTGAIATQSRTNPYFGFDGLDLLGDSDLSAQEVLERLIAGDEGRDNRQCLVLDRHGATAAWTGANCAATAAHTALANVAVAGNFLAGAHVLDAMQAAHASADGRLEDRLLSALVAGERAGGDQRGIRSAAIKVYDASPYPSVDLRADWSATPVADLSAILAATREPDYAEFFDALPRRDTSA